MSSVTRRSMLQGALAGAALASRSVNALGQGTAGAPIARKGRIKQSVCQWEYKSMTLDELCAMGQHLGLKGIDLLQPEEFEVPKKYGLICTMGYAGAGTIPKALNRVENHDMIEAAFRKTIPLAVKAGVPNLITFSGNRMGMSDEEGLRNSVVGLNRVKKMAEDAGITIVVELLNSKVNHKDYMADHTAWGVAMCKEVGSPNIKLLYDIYHMQIMEGDLIHTITDNIDYIGHFHTGGVPGRNDLNDQQEIRYDGVMRGIAATKFNGYVAHEFHPLTDHSLADAVALCDV